MKLVKRKEKMKAQGIKKFLILCFLLLGFTRDSITQASDVLSIMRFKFSRVLTHKSNKTNQAAKSHSNTNSKHPKSNHQTGKKPKLPTTLQRNQ